MHRIWSGVLPPLEGRIIHNITHNPERNNDASLLLSPLRPFKALLRGLDRIFSRILYMNLL